VQPTGQSVVLEQRHRAGLSQPGSSPGADSILKQPLEHRALDAGSGERIGCQ
jgi:hypothetical protein